MYFSTVCTREGELVSNRVPPDVLCRLLGLTDEGKAPFVDAQTGEPVIGESSIYKHRKKPGLYILRGFVDPSVVHVELRRKILARSIIAQACQTIREVNFSNERGAGTYYEHVAHTCFSYRTTQESQDEHFARQSQRAAKQVGELPKAA